MNLLLTSRRRKLLFAALYFSEGAPVGYVWWALPTKLSDAGVPVETVTTLTAMLVLPWALKFLWAPLVDTLRTSRWNHREWIIATQIPMGLTLLPMLWLAPSETLPLVTLLLVAHAMLAATQDVSIDAFCIAVVPERDRGAINGWMQVGYMGGRAVFGGAIHWIEQAWGQPTAMGLMLTAIWCTTLLVWQTRADDPPRNVDADQAPSWRAFARTLLAAFERRSTWIGLLFAATGGAAFESVGAVAGPMLITAGVAKANIGLFFALPVVLATAGGALVGGKYSDLIGRRRAVVVCSLALSLAVVVLAMVLRSKSVDTVLLRSVLVGLYFAVGAFTAATYAMLMDLTDPALGGTQFSAYMGATNLCEAWAGFTVGRLIASSGYPTAFLTMSAVSVLALFLLFGLRPARREA